MQLYLIRHPSPTHVTGLCYGRQDVAVDTESVARAAAAVRSRIPERVLAVSRIFSSPASRCRLLASELAAPREPRIAQDLAEMSFGSWEGLPWDAVPRDQVDAWARDVWHYKPGGAESAAMVAARWQQWASQVRDSIEDSAVAVTHAGVIRVALVQAGLLSTDAMLRLPIAFGSVHRISLAKEQVLG